MGLLDFILVPAAVRAAKDQTRVRLIFDSGNFVFDCDYEKNVSTSSFAYYLGLTGQDFNMSSLSSYLLKYAKPSDINIEDIGNSYADFAHEVAIENGDVYGDRELYVKAWTNPGQRGLDKNWSKDKVNHIFLDFSAYFLIDVLNLGIGPPGAAQ